MGNDLNKPVNLTTRNAPPVPRARTTEDATPKSNAAASNDAPVTNVAVANAPANSAAANNNGPANNAPAANNKPAARNTAPANNAPEADDVATADAPAKENKNHVMGFFEGFVKEGVDTVTGLYTLVTTNPITTAKGLVYMAAHPRLAVQAITEPYTTAAKNGDWGQLAGRVSFQALTILVSSGALSKSDKASKIAQPTATMTQEAAKVTTDMATRIGGKRAATEIVKSGLKEGTKAYNAKLAELTAQYTAQTAENLARRGIANKIATGIASTPGITDEALVAVMKAGGKKVSATEAYRFAAAGTKAGMKPAEIAAKLAELSAKRGGAALVAAETKLIGTGARNAALIAGAANPKSAAAIATQIDHYKRLLANTTDKTLAAGYTSQLEALKAAAAGNPRTADLVMKILNGQKVGGWEASGQALGANIDAMGNKIGQVGDNISSAGNAVKTVLDGPKTIGDYAKAIGNVPVAIGAGLDAAYQGTIDVLKKGLSYLPKMPKFGMPSWEKIAAVRVPSPWEILSSPVTVPLGAAGWALKNPVRALGAAGIAGNIGNTAKMGTLLAERKEDPAEPTSPGYKQYALQIGDTLPSIAKKELGDENRWEEIYELNRELFDSLGEDGELAAGTMIKLPDGTATQAPGDKPAAGGEAAAYKAGLLKLLDEKSAGADPEAKRVLGALKTKIQGMTPDAVFKLKGQLEEQGLVVGGTAPKPNAPASNDPAANKPGSNTPPSSNDPAANKPPVTPAAPPAPTAKPDYTVKRGDTLQGISQSQLGNWGRWKELVGLNSDKYPSLLSNPDFIQVGWKLALPAKPADAAKPAAPAANSPVGNTNGTPEPKPGPTAPKPADPAAAPKQPSAAQRAEIVSQFNLDNSQANWNNFWNEVNTYPKATVGPDTGTEADRKGLQGLLQKLGFKVETTGSYYQTGPNGRPMADVHGNPLSPTADAVIAFKRMAGIQQEYNVLGADGKPTPDVNEYVDARTRETMQVSLRLLQDKNIRGQGAMEATVKEAARLQATSIGPEVGSSDARKLVQQYLEGLGYPVQINGTFDQATTDAIIDFKRKSNLASPLKNDKGGAVYTPYVDGPTADALYQAIAKLATKK